MTTATNATQELKRFCAHDLHLLRFSIEFECLFQMSSTIPPHLDIEKMKKTVLTSEWSRNSRLSAIIFQGWLSLYANCSGSSRWLKIIHIFFMPTAQKFRFIYKFLLYSNKKFLIHTIH